jgi:hypothetical protein
MTAASILSLMLLRCLLSVPGGYLALTDLPGFASQEFRMTQELGQGTRQAGRGVLSTRCMPSGVCVLRENTVETLNDSCRFFLKSSEEDRDRSTDRAHWTCDFTLEAQYGFFLQVSAIIEQFSASEDGKRFVPISRSHTRRTNTSLIRRARHGKTAATDLVCRQYCAGELAPLYWFVMDSVVKNVGCEREP